jgi:hypothetical protein
MKKLLMLQQTSVLMSQMRQHARGSDDEQYKPH